MDPQALWHQANDHAAKGEWAPAAACLEAVLARRPGDVAVLARLSVVLLRAGRYRDALAASLEAARSKRATSPDILAQLLPQLRRFNQAVAFHRLLDSMGPPSGIPIPQLLLCGSQLSYFNEQERAIVYLDEARRADPDYVPTLLARAHVLTYLARFDEAEADLRRCLRRAPHVAQTYWLLSRLRKQTSENNHAAEIRVQLGAAGRSPSDRALLGYALHKTLDDLGEYAAATEALDLACREKRSTLDYRSADTRELVDALVRFAPGQRRGPPSPGGGSSRVPVFIVGMHRSGTTLLEQLLDAHRDVRGIGELYDFPVQMRQATDHPCRGPTDETIVRRAPQVDFADIGRRYLEGVEWRLSRERYFTDKLPSNFLNAGFICEALPHARILHVVRNPIDTCFSNLRELFSDANPYSYDQLELAAFHREYRRLMAHWHSRYPGRIMDVHYERLTGDTEAAMREVALFCGLEFEPAMVDPGASGRGVATASAVQVRQGISARDKPKWAPYAEYLQPMILALGA